MYNENKDTKRLGKYHLNGYFLTVLPKALFRIQPKVYGGAFFAKIVHDF